VLLTFQSYKKYQASFNKFMIAKYILLASSLCLYGRGVMAQQAIDTTFTTDRKPTTDARAKKKGILSTLSENFNVQNNGKQIINNDGKINTKAFMPTASIGASGSAAGKSQNIGLNTEKMPDLKQTSELGVKVGRNALRKAKNALSGNENTTKKAPFNGKTYEGLNVSRQVAQVGSGDRGTVYEFYVLRDDEDPSTYVRDIYWYDARGNRISSSARKETDNVQIMHGPYKKYVNEDLVEEGFYYAGAKHGRWEKYGKDFDGDWALVDKTYWNKGFPADSKISYYDASETKIKEVIPMHYGKVTGDYWAFFETGLLAEEGRFDDSTKIGRWKEYHKFGKGGRTKKVMQYGKDKYDTLEPYIITEYDNTGKVLYDNKTAKKEEEN
jgi:hypothetical protein